MIKKGVFALLLTSVVALNAFASANASVATSAPPINLPAITFGPDSTEGVLDLSLLQNNTSYNINCIMYDQTNPNNAPTFIVSSVADQGGVGYMKLNGQTLAATGNDIWQGQLVSGNSNNALEALGWYANSGSGSTPHLLFSQVTDSTNSGRYDTVVVYNCVAKETN